MSHKPSLRNLPTAFDCQECGMNVAPADYHPYIFCVMFKAGCDPRKVTRTDLTRDGLMLLRSDTT